MFLPIQTERLTIRPFTLDDTGDFAARRNHPDVARYQNWSLPYPLEKAKEVVQSLVEMAGPERDEWWMAVVADRASGATFGDLALHLSADGNTAEVGYTLGREHWGKGYAVEALSALIEYLFDTLELTRIFGMLHPDNPASAMVLERCGFLYEGHTRSSFWLDGEVSDDWIYGLLKEDWDRWRNRPRTPPQNVEFVEINVDNEQDVWRMKTHKTQEEFVAPMEWSYIDFLFPEVIDGAPVTPWMRGVKADGEYVGFVMLALVSEHHPEPYLWRLLIDKYHQRRGIASRVLELLEDECRKMGSSTLLTSWAEGKGSPRPFYIKHGFGPTGKIVDEETEARKTF